jgi:hypothetical protein
MEAVMTIAEQLVRFMLADCKEVQGCPIILSREAVQPKVRIGKGYGQR